MHFWWHCNGVVTMENSIELPEDLKYNYSIIQQFHCWVYTNKTKILIEKKIFTPMFITALFT